MKRCAIETNFEVSFIYTQVDIRVRVKGGGTTSQIYAIRQAIAKGMVAYYQKCKCYATQSSPLCISEECCLDNFFLLSSYISKLSLFRRR